MLIGIDVDGVLADLLKACMEVCEPLNAAVSDPVTCSMIPYHDYFRMLAPEHEAEMWKFIDENPGFVRGLPLMPGARSFVEALRGNGEVIAVTSPAESPVYWAHERAKWLQEELGFNRNQIIQTPRKELVDVDCLIEDNPAHLNRWAKERLRRAERLSWRLPFDKIYCPILFMDGRFKLQQERAWHTLYCSAYPAIIQEVKAFHFRSGL